MANVKRGRDNTVYLTIRADRNISQDLRFLFTLKAEEAAKKGDKVSWNDFLLGIFIEHISKNSEVVLKFRDIYGKILEGSIV